MMTTSECERARVRAAMTERGWVSDTTPLPMDVLSTGMPALSTSCLIRLSACAWAAPFPITINGLQDYVTFEAEGSETLSGKAVTHFHPDPIPQSRL